MKKFFEYIGLIAFTLFSFYYTDKVTKVMNNKDPLMISIKEYRDKTKQTCKEGYYTTDGVVLGVSGKVVSVNESYSNMVTNGFDLESMVYEEITCKVNKESTLDNFIIKGNETKNSVSLFINIKSLDLIESLINVSNNQNVKLNLLIDGKTLEKNKDLLKEFYNENYDIVYNGSNKEDLKLYIKTIKSFNKTDRMFCMSYNNIDNKNICSEEKINTLKTEYVYDKNVFSNTKNNFEKGGFYIYNENNVTLKELNTIINFIKGKNINVINVTEMIK